MQWRWWHPVITVPADTVSHHGARPSAGTAMATQLHLISRKLLCLEVMSRYLSWSEDVIQNGWWDFEKSCGPSGVNQRKWYEAPEQPLHVQQQHCTGNNVHMALMPCTHSSHNYNTTILSYLKYKQGVFGSQRVAISLTRSQGPFSYKLHLVIENLSKIINRQKIEQGQICV